jgi:hypothetical protein
MSGSKRYKAFANAFQIAGVVRPRADVQVECSSPTRSIEPTNDGHIMSGRDWALIQARFPKL